MFLHVRGKLGLTFPTRGADSEIEKLLYIILQRFWSSWHLPYGYIDDRLNFDYARHQHPSY